MRPLFDGPEWSFELIQQGLRRDGRHRAGRARPRHLSQPDRGHHRRADARRLFLDRHAADVPALVVRQALRARRGLLQARHAQPGLRARHQLRSLHQLRHGGELHDHAGAGDRARRLRPQPLLQEQLPVPDVDPARPHHRLSGLRQDLRGRVRGALRPRGRRERARCRARADEPGRQPRSAAAAAQRRQARAGARGAPAGARGGDLRRHLPHAARDHARRHGRADRGAERAAPPRPARGEPALFPREECAQARGLAARAAAHRAPAVAVLLSAAPDQDDERGLRHLRALRDHEPAVRARPADRRHHAGVPALALLGDLPARASTIAASAASIPMRSASP